MIHFSRGTLVLSSAYTHLPVFYSGNQRSIGFKFVIFIHHSYFKTRGISREIFLVSISIPTLMWRVNSIDKGSTRFGYISPILYPENMVTHYESFCDLEIMDNERSLNCWICGVDIQRLAHIKLYWKNIVSSGILSKAVFISSSKNSF